MRITRENYEIFFLDYHEGILSNEECKEVRDFVEANPDLKKEFYSFEKVDLPDERPVFNEKELLYKTGKPENFDATAIGYLEGDLTDEERKTFEHLLVKNPDQSKAYDRIKQTKLKADEDIHFAFKRSLYRQPTRVVAMKWLGRIAAILLLFFAVDALFTKQDHPTVKQPVFLAKETPVVAVPVLKKKPLQEKASMKEEEQLQAKSSKETTKKKIPVQPIKAPVAQLPVQRDTIQISRLPMLLASFEQVEPETNLLSPIEHEIKFEDRQSESITLDQYLAKRARKIGNEGILSINKIARAGLNLASEISGERIDYTTTGKGKVTSIEFESKLLAFTIPLKKE